MTISEDSADFCQTIAGENDIGAHGGLLTSGFRIRALLGKKRLRSRRPVLERRKIFEGELS